MKKIILLLIISMSASLYAMEQREEQLDATNPFSQEQQSRSTGKHNNHVDIEMGERPVEECAHCRELGQANSLFKRMLTHSNISRVGKHALTMVGLTGLYLLREELRRIADAAEHNAFCD